MSEVRMPAATVAAIALLLRHTRRPKVAEGECVCCDRERAANNSFHPPHDASQFCQSGGHDHCSCDTCF